MKDENGKSFINVVALLPPFIVHSIIVMIIIAPSLLFWQETAYMLCVFGCIQHTFLLYLCHINCFIHLLLQQTSVKFAYELQIVDAYLNEGI